ncbi:carbon-nitrogen hydrolase family protein [Flavobacterium sp. JP2137]|uniref:carbon-nitrogen hydrolase family protein n=1 Tax=Flavobacterium sp. JP2137 TaxID=3414510 RepID=UPI003D3000E0
MRGCISETIPERFDGLIYNTAILVDHTGLIGYQRKIQLPDYEKRLYAAGDAINALQYRDSTIGMMVCFDCWFAPVSARLKLQGAEISCHSTCFGGDVTPRILPIRALENQCFIISCNRIGAERFDGLLEAYRGESQIVDTDGNRLYIAGNTEVWIFVELDLAAVNKPKFGSLITGDFMSEHQKYAIELRTVASNPVVK